MASDMMLTDYSSAVFEYSLMEKPMVFFAYDLDVYDDFRGFYYPYEEMTPGPVVRTTEEVAEAILAAAGAFDPSAVKQFKDTYMCACDGHSTERILALMRDM